MHTHRQPALHRIFFFVILPLAIFVTACSISVPTDINLPPSQEVTSTPVLKTEASPIAVCPQGDCANLCVDRVAAFLKSTGKPGSPPRSSSRVGGPDNSITLTTYQIDGEQIVSPNYEQQVPAIYSSYQTATSSHEKMWQYFSSIIPADNRQELDEFVIFTDGVGGILASVSQSVNDPGHWALRVDILDANNPRDLTYTLMHEFGHLLTLNDSQVTPDTSVMANPDDQQLFQKDSAACTQFFASNGCSQPNSYINLFFQKFWQKIYPQWEKINNEKDQKNYMNLLGQFYINYHSSFVSEYSVTSPEEDIAETWAKFIFSRKPFGNDIASQKVLFFYSFPELVDLRTRIVNGICNFTNKK